MLFVKSPRGVEDAGGGGGGGLETTAHRQHATRLVFIPFGFILLVRY